MLVFCFGLLIFIILIVIAKAKVDDKYSAMERYVTNQVGFTPSIRHLDAVTGNGIAFDESTMNICLIKDIKGNLQSNIISYMDVLSSELCEGNETIMLSSRSGQSNDVPRKSLVHDERIYTIGSSSRQKKSSKPVWSLSLLITIKDNNQPLHRISFIHWKTEKNSASYISSIETARQWQTLLDGLIKRAARESTNKPITPT